MTDAMRLLKPTPAQAQALGRTEVINKSGTGPEGDLSGQFWVACCHECAHYLMAEQYGWDPGSITMQNESSAVTWVRETEEQRVPFRAGYRPRGGMRTASGRLAAQAVVVYQDAMISLAGPAASFLLQGTEAFGCESDEAHARARLREIGEDYRSAQEHARRVVRQHWPRIERKAEVLYLRYVKKFAQQKEHA